MLFLTSLYDFKPPELGNTLCNRYVPLISYRSELKQQLTIQLYLPLEWNVLLHRPDPQASRGLEAEIPRLSTQIRQSLHQWL